MRNVIDHIVIGAADLESGAAALEARLGVPLGPGGQHPDMGTHNRLMRTGRGEFLELIAIDPGATPPDHARWFGLDEAHMAERLAAGPAPIAWVVRTPSIEAAKAASPVDLGPTRRLRRGDLTWSLTVPETGVSAFGGLVPSFIQWDSSPLPAESMRATGLTLERIELASPDPDGLAGVLSALQLSECATIVPADAPAIRFAMRTPQGQPLLLA